MTWLPILSSLIGEYWQVIAGVGVALLAAVSLDGLYTDPSNPSGVTARVASVPVSVSAIVANSTTLATVALAAVMPL